MQYLADLVLVQLCNVVINSKHATTPAAGVAQQWGEG